MWPLINVSKNQVFTLLSVVSQAGLSGSFSGSCQAARPCMIFSVLVTLVSCWCPIRPNFGRTQARHLPGSPTQSGTFFCQVNVWLMFDSKNGMPARVRLDAVSVWFKNFVRGPVWIDGYGKPNMTKVGWVWNHLSSFSDRYVRLGNHYVRIRNHYMRIRNHHMRIGNHYTRIKNCLARL